MTKIKNFWQRRARLRKKIIAKNVQPFCAGIDARIRFSCRHIALSSHSVQKLFEILSETDEVSKIEICKRIECPLFGVCEETC
jgi:hypothetical protein